MRERVDWQRVFPCAGLSLPRMNGRQVVAVESRIVANLARANPSASIRAICAFSASMPPGSSRNVYECQLAFPRAARPSEMLGEVGVHPRGAVGGEIPGKAHVDGVDTGVVEEGDELVHPSHHRIGDHEIDGHLALERVRALLRPAEARTPCHARANEPVPRTASCSASKPSSETDTSRCRPSSSREARRFSISVPFVHTDVQRGSCASRSTSPSQSR